MVKRTPIRPHLLLAFVLVMLLTSWESTRMSAAFVEGAIPQESIRLRILANSDRPADQRLKRLVRDEVVRRMNTWVQELETTSIADARLLIEQRLPELEQAVGAVLKQQRSEYPFTVELGQVEFPAKLYGDQLYPAGMYEALRITIGSGQGQNWWCVLFPPLCFVDAVSGEAVAAAPEEAKAVSAAAKTAAADVTPKTAAAKNAAGADKPAKDQAANKTAAKRTADEKPVKSAAEGTSGKAAIKAAAVEPAEEAAPEVRWFIVDMAKQCLDTIKKWFS